jgi:hypothetical protein
MKDRDRRKFLSKKFYSGALLGREVLRKLIVTLSGQ